MNALSANRDNLISSFSIWVLVFFFFSLALLLGLRLQALIERGITPFQSFFYRHTLSLPPHVVWSWLQFWRIWSLLCWGMFLLFLVSWGLLSWRNVELVKMLFWIPSDDHVIGVLNLFMCYITFMALCMSNHSCISGLKSDLFL